MLSHQAAKRIANNHLVAEGSDLRAVSATRDSRHGVWIVSYFDPARPDERLDGGALVVRDNGDVHGVGSAPGSIALLAQSFGQVAAATDHRSLRADWRHQLADELRKDYWLDLMAFVADERAHAEVFPPPEKVFAAFELTRFDSVKVVILGQDPYHGKNQANG